MDRIFTPRHALLLALLLSGLLAGLKLWAWWLSDSSAVLASAADSLSDIVVSLSGFMALLYATRPADHDHRFGHGKMEGVAALFHGAFIIGIAVFVVLDSVRNFFLERPIEMKETAIAVMAISIVVNLILLGFQKMTLRRNQSLILQADHANYTGDILTHGAILTALSAQFVTGALWIDPLCAFLVALWMIHAAKGIMGNSLNMLLDRELPEATRTHIRDSILSNDDVLGLHDLRTREVGTHISLSFDIEVDPQLTFQAAHEISKQVETALLKTYPDAEIMIHVDPAGNIHDSRHQIIEQRHRE